MKQYFFLGLLIVITLFACKEYPCNKAISEISFIAFQRNETDTIIIRKFEKATNFNQLVDTFLLNQFNSSYNLSNDTFTVSSTYGNDMGLLSKYDYEVYLPQINRDYKLTEITEDIQSRNAGLSMDKVGCINPIKSYKINGLLVSGEYNYYIFYLHK